MTSPADLAATVREALPAAGNIPSKSAREQARAALDALQAQAEATREFEAETIAARTERDVSDDAAATWATLLAEAQQRAEAAEAERDRLAEELEWVGELNKANIENANRLRETAAEMERALLRTQAIAMRGVGPDTTPEEALATIAAYVEKRLDAITAAQREGLE